jgi:hypothetical protein
MDVNESGDFSKSQEVRAIRFVFIIQIGDCPLPNNHSGLG